MKIFIIFEDDVSRDPEFGEDKIVCVSSSKENAINFIKERSKANRSFSYTFRSI